VAEAPERGSLYLAYLLIRHMMQPYRLPAVFERVRMEPHRRLVREPRRVDFAQVRQVDARLYPGDVFQAFSTDGERYEDATSLPPDFAGVGAISLRPGQTAALDAVVQVMVQR